MNVQVDDLAVLLPIGIAANVCDVDVNVLTAQLALGQATCDAVSIAQT